MGVQRDVEDRSLPRPVGETGRRSVGNRKERLYIATMRVPRGHPSIPPSSFWAQRSAQPAGIYIDILLKCIRIVIVAFGSAPIPDNFRFAIGYDGDFIPMPLTRDFAPCPHFRFALILVTVQWIPKAYFFASAIAFS